MQPATRNMLITVAVAYLVASTLHAYYSNTGDMNAKARPGSSTALCCDALRCAVLRCAVLCCATLRCIALCS